MKNFSLLSRGDYVLRFFASICFCREGGTIESCDCLYWVYGCSTRRGGLSGVSRAGSQNGGVRYSNI